MIVSKRKYYCDFLLAVMVIGVLIFLCAPIANQYLWHIDLVTVICRYAIIGEITIIMIILIATLIKNKGIKNYISRMILFRSIEDNLISIGAYIKQDNKVYVELPKIKIKKGIIIISLRNLKIRTIIERYWIHSVQRYPRDILLKIILYRRITQRYISFMRI